MPEKTRSNLFGVNEPLLGLFRKAIGRLTLMTGKNQWSERQVPVSGSLSIPAVFWLISHDHSDDNSHALQILQRYAGTELPEILLKYGQDQKLPEAAFEALLKFDNDQGPSSNKRKPPPSS